MRAMIMGIATRVPMNMATDAIPVHHNRCGDTSLSRLGLSVLSSF